MWELEITTIDVGQGESALLVAHNPAIGESRAMLIDGGWVRCVPVVHEYVRLRLEQLGVALDHIVVSHYDNDHSSGVVGLLASDNLSIIAQVIASAAVAAVGVARAAAVDAAHQLAAGAAAAAAAIGGGYDLPPKLHSAIAVQAGEEAQIANLPAGLTPAEYADLGADIGTAHAAAVAVVNGRLAFGTGLVRRTASAAGLGAVNAAPAAAQDVASRGAFGALTAGRPFSVYTAGRYRQTDVIDTGDLPGAPHRFNELVTLGEVRAGSGFALAPDVQRERTSVTRAMLGTELLWHSGRQAQLAPQDSPAAFLMACERYMWKAPAHAVPIAGGAGNNSDSIGLIVRFGQFFFYTGGDLPSAGEELVATAVMNFPLPDPQGGLFAVAPRIAAFKCGHHGADGSTSAHFLNVGDARAAIISCGISGFGPNAQEHPNQTVVDRLRLSASVWRFYLTNCNYPRNGVPASLGLPQVVVGNRSRVCGDNNMVNMAAVRERGTCFLFLDENDANAPAGPLRVFYVEYYNKDPLPGVVPAAPTGTMKVTHRF